MFAEITAQGVLITLFITGMILLAGVVKIGRAVLSSDTGKATALSFLAKFFK